MWILIAVVLQKVQISWERKKIKIRGADKERKQKERNSGQLYKYVLYLNLSTRIKKFGLVFSQRVLIALNSEGLFSWALSIATFTVSEKKTLKRPRVLQQSFLPAFSHLAARLHYCAFSQSWRDLTWIRQLWIDIQKALKGKRVCLTLHVIWFPIKVTVTILITWNVNVGRFPPPHPAYRLCSEKFGLDRLLRITLYLWLCGHLAM